MRLLRCRTVFNISHWFYRQMDVHEPQPPVEVVRLEPQESTDSLRSRAEVYFNETYGSEHSASFIQAAQYAGFRDRAQADAALTTLTGFQYGPHIQSGEEIPMLDGHFMTYYDSPKDRERIWKERQREHEEKMAVRKSADRYMDLAYIRHYDAERAARECGFKSRIEADGVLTELTESPYSDQLTSGTRLRDVQGQEFTYYATAAEALAAYESRSDDFHYRCLAQDTRLYAYAERNEFVFADDLPSFLAHDIEESDLWNLVPEGGSLTVTPYSLPERPYNSGDYRKLQGALFYKPSSRPYDNVWQRVDRTGAENPPYVFLDGVPVPIRSATSPGDMQPILVASAGSPLPDRIFTEKGTELPKVSDRPGWYFNTLKQTIHYDSKNNQIFLQA